MAEKPEMKSGYCSLARLLNTQTPTSASKSIRLQLQLVADATSRRPKPSLDSSFQPPVSWSWNTERPTVNTGEEEHAPPAPSASWKWNRNTELSLCCHRPPFQDSGHIPFFLCCLLSLISIFTLSGTSIWSAVAQGRRNACLCLSLCFWTWLPPHHRRRSVYLSGNN
uniref:Uncharacterized protein n=1 Tax=Nelumbo nucifera TaxID=4432 RepID=A0A822YQ45_NELNU|nr:TPA_asm: hypothetical protein HUJ06_005330 [Nelumbo nucifera]